RPETFTTLAEHFFDTFPQLSGLRFTHKWGGPIDTCSRFFSFFTTAYGKKVAMAAGFTGLGVGASRFAGTVMLDLLSGESTELTELEMVRKLPLPFPPEPAAWLGLRLTTQALIQADENQGRRGRPPGHECLGARRARRRGDPGPPWPAPQGPRRRGRGRGLLCSCRGPSPAPAGTILRTSLPARLPCRRHSPHIPAGPAPLPAPFVFTAPR